MMSSDCVIMSKSFVKPKSNYFLVQLSSYCANLCVPLKCFMWHHGDFQLVDSMDWLSILPEGFWGVLYEDTCYFHRRICLLKLF